MPEKISHPLPNQKPPSEETEDKGRYFWLFLHAVLVFWFVIIVVATFRSAQNTVIPYSEFLERVKNGTIQEVVVSDKTVTGAFANKSQKSSGFTTYRVDDGLSTALLASGVKFSAASSEHPVLSALYWTFIIVLALSVISLFTKKAGSEGGIAPFMGIERSKAKIVAEDKICTSFADVAGVDEALEELQEVVNFLRDPAKYSRLGGRLPKGILLVGPPGTGKTLLARAVAGEAGVAFFSISGSEFVELFVGVGAARVRDLFAQARLKAPCIIFIDELDALGRTRTASPLLGGHDEKEQTLNQLLVELDGFDTSAGVILLAATNRPETLDKALLRAGRFDRHVVVDRPDKFGRVAILRVHLKKIIVDDNLDVVRVAAMTPGFTGADLANVVNEAALLAARRAADKVGAEDFDNAIERTVAGLEKKNRLLSEKERRVVAYHEMGHALVSMCLPSMDSLEKVSIIPRGIAALGYTIQRPEEDRFILTSKELRNKLAALLGGRVSEVLVFGDTSTGAADDLAKATDLARAMITRYGMDDRLGMVAYEGARDAFLDQAAMLWYGQSNISEETTYEIERAVKALLDESYSRANEVLTANRRWLDVCAEKLLCEEVLSAAEIQKLCPSTSNDETVLIAVETAPVSC